MMWYLAWLSAFVFLIQLMPPKRGTHSEAAQTVANATYHFLSGRCGRQGQPSFGSSVLAFADMPGITEALGFENGITSADVVVGENCSITSKVHSKTSSLVTVSAQPRGGG